MRRILIKQETLDLISQQSSTAAQKELSEAADVLAKALGKDSLSLHSFNDDNVVYETCDDTYVHAGYEIKNGEITFNNVEEMVVDESSQKESRQKVIGEMLEAIIKGDEARSQSLFADYSKTINWNESFKAFEKASEEEEEEEEGDRKPFPPKKDKFSVKGKKERSFGKKKGFPFGKKKDKEDRKERFEKLAKAAGKNLKEALVVANNVLEYVDYYRVGPSLAETVIRSDEQGNVTDVKVPVSRARNEGKIIQLNHMNTKKKVQMNRTKAAGFCENQSFCKAMFDLKRCNNAQDPKKLDETLSLIVKSFPEVLYLTQNELAQVVAESLRMMNVAKFDDQTCDFMAEGILRKAHEAYLERVAQIVKLAGAPQMQEGVDAYLYFQTVCEQFYPAIDEQFGLERKVYNDLYETFAGIWHAADRRGDDALKSEAAGYLNALAAVLNDEVRPNIELAEEAASWLDMFVEANVSGAGTWSVSNKAHTTFNGDHPDMAKKAKVDAIPSKFPGDWGDEAPMVSQDKKGYKGNSEEARKRSWSNIENKDTWPALKNPYIPKPFGDYTMKGEKGVDKEPTGQFWATYRDKETWPELKNPYTPKEKVGTGGKGYKMKNGSDTDLVVDK